MMVQVDPFGKIFAIFESDANTPKEVFVSGISGESKMI